MTDFMAQHIERIDAVMVKGGITRVMKDGLCIREIPTHPSQIRPERTPMLWVAEPPDTRSVRQMLVDKIARTKDIDKLIKFNAELVAHDKKARWK